MNLRRLSLSLLSVFACLFVLFSALPGATVAAADDIEVNNNFLLSNAYVYTGQSVWVKAEDVIYKYNPNRFGFFMVCFGETNVGMPYNGFRLDFSSDGSDKVSVDSGNYMVFTIYMDDNTHINTTVGFTPYFNVALYDDLGGLHTVRTTPVYDELSQYWYGSLIVQVGTGEAISVDRMIVESNMPSAANGMSLYDLNIRTSLTKNLTDAERIHQETLSAIKDSTDQITGSIEESKNGIVSKLDDVKNWIVNGLLSVVNSITELPGKIWEKIESGLKALFVPSSEYISGFKDRFDGLLTDRFGGVYRAASVIRDLLVDVVVVDKADETITLPVTKIPLPGGHEFSFGGYDVRIVPEGFSGFLLYVKLAVGVVATILFVNALRGIYDKVMGAED